MRKKPQGKLSGILLDVGVNCFLREAKLSGELPFVDFWLSDIDNESLNPGQEEGKKRAPLDKALTRRSGCHPSLRSPKGPRTTLGFAKGARRNVICFCLCLDSSTKDNEMNGLAWRAAFW